MLESSIVADTADKIHRNLLIPQHILQYPTNTLHGTQILAIQIILIINQLLLTILSQQLTLPNLKLSQRINNILYFLIINPTHTHIELIPILHHIIY